MAPPPYPLSVIFPATTFLFENAYQGIDIMRIFQKNVPIGVFYCFFPFISIFPSLTTFSCFSDPPPFFSGIVSI